MKTAIIITGHLRTFEKCLPNLGEHVFNHFRWADYFVSTIADDDWDRFSTDPFPYHSRRVTYEATEQQPDCVADLVEKGARLPSTWTPGKPYMAEQYPISVSPQAVAAQLWQLEQGWHMMRKHEEAVNEKFECVIRCRPDIFIRSGSIPRMDDIEPLDAFVPWWGRFGGTNDRFAIMGRDAAEAYFTTYSQIPAIIAAGGNLHPETLVLAALKRAKAKVAFNLGVMFSTERNDGTSRLPEITQEDWQGLLTM